tara:strand:- start:721 stop:969 length:249 start_codon:yes stop_codon:yes gene_type:complete
MANTMVEVEMKLDIKDIPNKNGKFPYTITAINYKSVNDLVVWAVSVKDVQEIATRIYNIGEMLKDGLIDNGEAKRLYNHCIN